MNTKLFLQDFGRLLKKTRKAQKVSQAQAALEMGIDYRHYQNIEGGKINLRMDTFLKLVKYYNFLDERHLTIAGLTALGSPLTPHRDPVPPEKTGDENVGSEKKDSRSSAERSDSVPYLFAGAANELSPPHIQKTWAAVS